jgi:kynurenine formamidase
MKITIHAQPINYTVDLANPIDISLPLADSDQNPLAWYLEKPRIEPVTSGNWVGQVAQGSSTNFNNIYFNPHGHGTHTECLGHITKEFYSINRCLTTFFFMTELISITPTQVGEDEVITKDQIAEKLNGGKPEALVIRTLPNALAKKNRNYSHTNPPYLTEEAAAYIREIGITHLLIDLPSVDREEDEGKLLAHKAFWNVKNVVVLNADARMDCTITELIYVPDTVLDGNFLLNLQIASFENDASPSKPVLYALINSQGD